MIPFSVRRVWNVLGIAAVLLSTAALAHAQSKSNCRYLFDFKSATHESLDCIEGLFSEPRYHFTFSSLPPGNGFSVGGVFEQSRHSVSPYAAPRDPVFDSDPTKREGPTETQGTLSATDAKLAAVGSINGSWMVTGSLTVMPRGYRDSHRTDLSGDRLSCNRFGPFCTKSVLAVHFEGTHRSLQTISFYGMGPVSPAIKHTFHQNDTYGVASARMPLADWITSEGGVELLQPDLPATSDPLSVSKNFSEASAPGLQSQPFFVHSHVGVMTSTVFDWNPVTNDDPLNRTGPLMKRNLLFNLRNSAEYHWYSGASAPEYSFQKFVMKNDESIQLGSNVRRQVKTSDVGGGLSRIYYALLRRACGDANDKAAGPDAYVLKVTQQCDYGKLDLRSQMTLSSVGAGSTVPFYLRPTVGGSDIDSQASLRGFPNYRFRDMDAEFVQVEYSVPLYDPVGLMVFYDAGTVGPTFSSLSFSRLRQDAGVGATFRLQGNVVASTYLAWGAGHGPLLNYNFSKLF